MNICVVVFRIRREREWEKEKPADDFDQADCIEMSNANLKHLEYRITYI